jgi:hypothetical protein
MPKNDLEAKLKQLVKEKQQLEERLRKVEREIQVIASQL